jgi:hypothetical protein
MTQVSLAITGQKQPENTLYNPAIPRKFTSLI